MATKQPLMKSVKGFSRHPTPQWPLQVPALYKYDTGEGHTQSGTLDKLTTTLERLYKVRQDLTGEAADPDMGDWHFTEIPDMTQASNEGATGRGPKQARKADCLDSAAWRVCHAPHPEASGHYNGGHQKTLSIYKYYPTGLHSSVRLHHKGENQRNTLSLCKVQTCTVSYRLVLLTLRDLAGDCC